jgi:hypothetical protein
MSRNVNDSQPATLSELLRTLRGYVKHKPDFFPRLALRAKLYDLVNALHCDFH